MALSRGESVKRYLLTLPASDRADVLTVRDVRGADVLRGMHELRALRSGADTLLFSFVGAAQRRTLKSYGTWIVARRGGAGKLAATETPSPDAIKPVCYPPDIAVSRRVLDASLRLERQLRLDLAATLSVPLELLNDDKAATRLVVDLLTLAPLVSGREGSKPLQSSCGIFSVASFAASLLLGALVRSYNDAATRHRAASESLAHGDARLAFLAASKPCAPFVPGAEEPISRLVMLLSSMDRAERLRWEVKCAKALLRAAGTAPRLPRSSRGQPLRLALHSYMHVSPALDKQEGFSELLRAGAAHTLTEVLNAAPLAHACLHKTLFGDVCSPATLDNLAGVLMQLEGKDVRIAPSGKLLGLGFDGGKFGSGSSMFNTYADLEGRREYDPLLVAHDDEWTQMGRITDAARSIEAKLTGVAQLQFDEQQTLREMNWSMGMAAVEKKLESMIPAPVYPEMRVKKPARPQSPGPSAGVEAPTPPARPALHEEATVSLPERKPNAWNNKSATQACKQQDPACTTACDPFHGPCLLSPCQKCFAQDASQKPPSFADILRNKQAHGPNRGGESKPNFDAPEPLDQCAAQAPVPKGVWGGNAAKSLARKQWSATEATQTATGVIFPDSHAPVETCPAHAAAARVPESISTRCKGKGRQQATQKPRYNPLRPAHKALAMAAESRGATARRLHAEVKAFLKQVEPSVASRCRRNEIVDQVQQAVAACWPEATVEVYGSFATDLFLPHSDVDLLVMQAETSGCKTPLQMVSARLRGLPWCRYMKAIENATVPVVKLTADVSLLRAQAGAQYMTELSVEEQEEEEVEERSCIPVDVTFDCNIGNAPIALRDFVCAQLARFPVIRPLVLVLKHFLLQQGLNDAYKGGLSSHAVILLLIFYFNIPEVAASHDAGLDEASPEYMDPCCWYGEWLMRVMQWLSEFPFSDVGIGLQDDCTLSYLPLTDNGFCMLTTGECDPQLPDVDKVTRNELHIEDPFNTGNIAKGCFEWWLVRRSLQGAYRILRQHQETSPLSRIFGGVAEGKVVLDSLFDRGQVSAAMEVVQREQVSKQRR